jgi:D-glycero-D-manno-heptose 1,7-bisphosphate phosphatase
MNKAVFVDKDGTLVENVPYNIDPDKIRIYADVPEALKSLKKNDFKIIVITNQSGISMGYFSEDELKKANQGFIELMKDQDLEIDGFYYCPHHPEGKIAEYAIECMCRKPKPGLIIQAAKELDIDLSASWVIGDILNDVEAGNLAGCKSILINNGNETEWFMDKMRIADYTVKNMEEAVRKIPGRKRGGDMYERGIKKQDQEF